MPEYEIEADELYYDEDLEDLGETHLSDKTPEYCTEEGIEFESEEERTVHEIHGYMRNKTHLAPGTTVDNRKGHWAMFVEDEDPENIPNYGGAIRHAKDYAEMEKNTGDDK